MLANIDARTAPWGADDPPGRFMQADRSSRFLLDRLATHRDRNSYLTPMTVSSLVCPSQVAKIVSRRIWPCGGVRSILIRILHSGCVMLYSLFWQVGNVSVPIVKYG